MTLITLGCLPFGRSATALKRLVVHGLCLASVVAVEGWVRPLGTGKGSKLQGREGPPNDVLFLIVSPINGIHYTQNERELKNWRYTHFPLTSMIMGGVLRSTQLIQLMADFVFFIKFDKITW